jgi:hypothetical protein
MSFGERFLAEPDLFPARPSGEPWGELAIVLDLPGGPYAIDGLAPQQVASIEPKLGRYVRMLEGGAPAQSTIARVFRAAESDYRRFDLRGWDYVLDTDCSPGSVRLAGLGLTARLDWRPTLGGALWTSDPGGPAFPGIFENFCRVLCAYRTVECGGAVLHAAGVAREGRGFLFVGRSGAGKTTVSRASLAQGAEVLSDDLNALLPGPSGPLVAQLPFTGDLAATTSANSTWPLAALLRLEKSDRDELTPLSRAIALTQLVACSPFVNVDPYRLDALIVNLEALLAHASTHTLRFRLAGTFWSILDRKWLSSTEGAS